MNIFQTILHPTDLSESAKPALEVAARLAHNHGARLIVLHVVAPPVVYGEMGASFPILDMKETLEAERIRLEGVTAGSGAECRVVEGTATDAILDFARNEPCDLIVMGTHGRGGVARLLFGSVAADVLRRSPCPVLAVKPPGSHQPHKAGEAAAAVVPGAAARPLFPIILHPTDFSERSRRAFDFACTLARGGGQVIVLHVFEMVHVASEGYEQALHERLRELEYDDPSVRVEYKLCEGDSASEIIREAATSNCDLIALGTHGRTGLDRFRAGSVAEAVLHGAGCMVLAVKVPAEVQVRSPGHPSALKSTVF